MHFTSFTCKVCVSPYVSLCLAAILTSSLACWAGCIVGKCCYTNWVRSCITSVTAKAVPEQFVHGFVFALTVGRGCIDIPGP